ncbi:nicotinamide phosphoribosyltransferase [Dunaliella salina]|uniref:Nicotinamide phosphoribosyltransferase n=1 Tax=Dunaliella salina TaxID=3046 RepID=A0ABQ7GBE0_DUNSA|nr:nicotinamide phosphoribosyltransferase [Dunaliella salina]|eukprot:KAF5831924.1 nicotinamide phosphoribosyltransferase [Dunaliella salina]
MFFAGVPYLAFPESVQFEHALDAGECEARCAFYRTHMAPAYSAFPFPKALFEKFVRENDGYFPVKVEGCITAEDDYAPMCTFLETLLTMIWYPTTVATLSRRARDIVEATFARSSDQGKASPLMSSRLQDFGFRGCTSVEQSILGGTAHLLSFTGSDTMSAAYFAQALSKVLPAISGKKVGKGGYLVLRPDSGDPTEAVLMALEAAEKVFGCTTNTRGFKVINGCGVIQGDGINIQSMEKITLAVEQAGFAADNVTYGMGGGLLQKVNRDTMSFATKLNHVVYADGTAIDIMKQPLTDPSKYSLPGVLAVKRVNGVPTVFPADSGEVSAEDNLLKVVYDRGPVAGFTWDDFDTVKSRLRSEWEVTPLRADNLSPSLQAKIVEQTRLRGSKVIDG